jgi:hypothetical protein
MTAAEPIRRGQTLHFALDDGHCPAFRRSSATELIRHENIDTLQHYVRLTIADLKKTHVRCHPREGDPR